MWDTVCFHRGNLPSMWDGAQHLHCRHRVRPGIHDGAVASQEQARGSIFSGHGPDPNRGPVPEHVSLGGDEE